MKLIIDLPNKTIAHIRSDYGHKYFGCIGDEDKKIIMKAIYDGTPLEEEFEKIKERILSNKTYKHFSCMATVYDFEIKKVIDNRIKELKGENNE